MQLPKVDIRERIARRRNTLHEVIALSAGGLFVGEQTRDIMCPQCDGGNAKEKSFSLRREEGKILYKCWRAGCAIKGVLASNGSLIAASHPTELTETFLGRRYTQSLGPLTISGAALFYDKFQLKRNELVDEGRISYSAFEDRYAFPVFSPHYQNRGMTLRSFANNKTKFPKWDAYQNFSGGTANPWMGWYIRTSVQYRGNPVVVVEDPISALKISRQFKSCFLNGTNIDLEKLLEISKVAGNKGIIIALDKDATAKAIDIVHNFKFFLGDGVTCSHLEKDAKYMSDEEILSAFGQKEEQEKKHAD